MQPIFSIVIPVMNGRTSLELVFRALAAHTLPREQFECIVVDDGSTDGTAEFLKRYRADFNLRTFFHPSNQGRSQARNTGSRQATGEFLVFLDADMLAEPDWLACYQDALAPGTLDIASGGRYHLNLGAKTGDGLQPLGQITATGSDSILMADIPAQFGNIRRAAQPAMYPSLAMQKFEAQLPEACCAHPESMLAAYSFITSNVAVRRALFERTFGFDLSMRRGEDSDLGVRLWEAGARFGFASNARAYHMYYSGQGDRNNTWTERLSFFYRHPYLLAFLIPLWFAQQDQPDPVNTAPGLFDSLLTLLDAKDRHAEIDLTFEYNRAYRQPFPAECIYDRAFMVDYLCEHSGIAPNELETYLDQALAQGLVIQQRDGKTFFDMQHTMNWLRRCTLFQEYEFKHARYIRLQPTFFDSFPESVRKNVKTPAAQEPLREPLMLQCHGHYKIELPLHFFPQGKVDGTLNMALPIKHRAQTDLQITRCLPENLLDYADPQQAMIREFPLAQATRNAESITLEYEFNCQVHEYWAENHPAVAESAAVLNGFLRPSYPQAQLTKLQAILTKIFPGPVSDPYMAARMIYFWVLENTVYLQNLLPDTTIMDTRFGSCIQQTRLFINLCRLLRIPAREQSGMIFGRPCVAETGQKVQMANRGYTLLNHAWAEFYTPTRGWVPADMATSMGKRLLTAVNVKDETIREEVIRDSQRYDDYYFGHTDPFRIYSSPEINKVITCPIVPNMEVEALKQLIFNTHHQFICNFSFIEAKE